jgi:hypothetical protein
MSTKENHQNKPFDYQTELKKIWQQYYRENDGSEDTKIVARVGNCQAKCFPLTIIIIVPHV